MLFVAWLVLFFRASLTCELRKLEPWVSSKQQYFLEDGSSCNLPRQAKSLINPSPQASETLPSFVIAGNYVIAINIW